MSFPVTKVVIGLGSVGGVSVVGYLSATYLFPKSEEKKFSISKLFEEQGRTLLTRGQNDDQWNARWKSYISEGKNSWNLKDYKSVGTNNTKASNSFIDKCVFNSKAEVSGIEDSLYEEVVKYCSKEFKISELIAKDSRFIILDTAQNTDEAAWKSVWQNYLTDNGSEGNSWDVQDLSTSRQLNSVPPANFKTKCGEKKDEVVFWEKDLKFVNFIRWCTKANVSIVKE